MLVEGHLVLDDASGLEAIVDSFVVDRLLFQASSKTFNEDVVPIVPWPARRESAFRSR